MAGRFELLLDGNRERRSSGTEFVTVEVNQVEEVLTPFTNLIPADAYFGRARLVLLERERIKRKTIANRCLLHRTQAA
jgi:hypothetical protein